MKNWNTLIVRVSLVMTFALTPIVSFGFTSSITIDGVSWSYEYVYETEGKSWVRILGCNKHEGDLQIPSSIFDCPVLEIADDAFSYGRISGFPNEVTSVTIPDCVTSIGKRAFRDCSRLTSVIIPQSVTNVGDFAFCSCASLKSVTIPFGVKRIGESAFYECYNLTTVTMPLSVTSIGDSAFGVCYSLSSVAIPSGVRSIGRETFSSCWALKSVTIPSGVTNIGEKAFNACEGLASLSIPNGVISIGSKAFRGCRGMKSVTIPPSVRSIGQDAFADCGELERVDIVDLSKWCVIAFDGSMANPLYCAQHLYLDGDEVEKLTIPYGVNSLAYTFCNCCALTSVTIPQSVTSIGAYSFSGCSKLSNVGIPSSVTSIGSYAFENCLGLTKMLIPASVTSLPGVGIFKGCSNLKELEFAGDAPTVGSILAVELFGVWANLYVPRGAVGWDQFGDGKWHEFPINFVDYFEVEFDIGVCEYKGGGALRQYLRQGAYPTVPIYDIPIGYISQGWDNDPMLPVTSSIKYTLKLKLDDSEHAETIGDYTWQYRVTPQGAVIDSGKSGVPAVTPSPEGAITVPETLGSMGVVGVGTYAFYGCDRMTSIALPKDLAEIAYYAFKGCSSLKSINIPSGVREIGFYAFNGCVSLTDIAIPESVESIGESAFLNCTGLGNGVVIKNGCVLTVNGQCPACVDLPEGTRLVAGAAFKDCQTLTAVKFPSTLKTIETYAFSGCTMLTSVYIPDSVTRIGYSAFIRDSKLGTVRLSNSLKAIEMDVFSRCGSLTEIDIPNGVGEIGVGAFGVCSKLQRVSIPESVTNIMTQAFSDCSELREITLPSKLKKISSSLFRGCGNLPSIVLPHGVSEIQHDAFEGCASLNSVIIPFGVRDIDYNAFRDCAKLRIISVPKSVDAIGEYAFYNCAGITEIHVAKGDSARVKDMLTASKSDLKYASIQFIELDDPIPELQSDATADEVASALNGSVDARLMLCITDAETYSQYRAWALKIGADEVKNSENAWVSFALDSDALLEKSPVDEDLAIEEFKPTDEAGGFDFTVRVKDIEIGSGALAENLKKVFGLTGATTLDAGAFKQENVDVEFDTPKDGMLKFTAKPAKVSDRFFMRVKVK